MLLDNLKSQLKEDADQEVDTSVIDMAATAANPPTQEEKQKTQQAVKTAQ